MMFQQAREAVVETCINLADMGYLAGTGGNLALRVDHGHYLVTPSATDYYTMGPLDVCVLSLTDAEQIEGEKTPSVEAGLHARVLLARPDCTASVHTHQPIASAYTLLAMALEVQDSETTVLLGKTIPCVSYAPSGTGWLAKRVGKAFTGSNHACLMRNHGVVCVGIDVQQAIDRVIALESACAKFFRLSLTTGSRLPTTSMALIEQTLLTISQKQTETGIGN